MEQTQAAAAAGIQVAAAGIQVAAVGMQVAVVRMQVQALADVVASCIRIDLDAALLISYI